MRLAEWLEAQGLNQTEAAARLGITQGHVSKLVREGGGRRITAALAHSIEIKTNGAVPVSAWAEQATVPVRSRRRSVRGSSRRSLRQSPENR